MEAEKIPQLASMLTPDEMAHVQAFPSIIRIGPQLCTELRAHLGKKTLLQGINFHRVIDNEAIHLSASQLWVQLNYHLIHLMDFLPIADWSGKRASLAHFARLHALLSDARELQVRKLNAGPDFPYLCRDGTPPFYTGSARSTPLGF